MVHPLKVRVLNKKQINDSFNDNSSSINSSHLSNSNSYYRHNPKSSLIENYHPHSKVLNVAW